MLLTEEEYAIFDRIQKRQVDEAKVSSLKRISSYLHKFRSASVAADSLFQEALYLDFRNFLPELAGLLADPKGSSDCPRYFLMITLLIKFYPDFEPQLRQKVRDLKDAQLRPQMKLFMLLHENRLANLLSIYSHHFDSLPSMNEESLLAFVTWYHKVASQSEDAVYFKNLLNTKLRSHSSKLVETATRSCKELDIVCKKMRSEFENKGGFGPKLQSEFTNLLNSYDVTISLFKRLDLGDNIPTPNLSGLTISDDGSISFADAPSSSSINFETEEEQSFYRHFDDCIPEPSSEFTDQQLLSLLLSVESVKDADSLFGKLANSTIGHHIVIYDCFVEACRVFNQRIPLYSRLLTRCCLLDATLKEHVCDSLMQRLISLISIQNAVAGLRFRFCSIFGELVKFDVLDVGSLYRVLFACCQSGSNASIEMLCILFENCARLIGVHSQDVRYHNLVEALQRLASSDKSSNVYKVNHILSYLQPSQEFKTLSPLFYITNVPGNESQLDRTSSIFILCQIISHPTRFSPSAHHKCLKYLQGHLQPGDYAALAEYAFEEFIRCFERNSLQSCLTLLGIMEYIFGGHSAIFKSLQAMILNFVDHQDSTSEFSSHLYSLFGRRPTIPQEASIIEELQTALPRNDTKLIEDEFSSAYKEFVKINLSTCLNRRVQKDKPFISPKQLLLRKK